ncbi:hypothetical protein HK104_001692, partial [Borealophlyctis nickersoniae]
RPLPSPRPPRRPPAHPPLRTGRAVQYHGDGPVRSFPEILAGEVAGGEVTPEDGGVLRAAFGAEVEGYTWEGGGVSGCDQFCVGRHGQDISAAPDLYVIDFGLASYYLEEGRHMKNVRGGGGRHKSKTGTARYASLNVHKGSEHTRRDDLESLAYILVELAKGALPWANMRAFSSQQGWHKIGEVKRDTYTADLTEDLPKEFQTFIDYARNLTFTQEPDYGYVARLFEELYERMWGEGKVLVWSEEVEKPETGWDVGGLVGDQRDVKAAVGSGGAQSGWGRDSGGKRGGKVEDGVGQGSGKQDWRWASDTTKGAARPVDGARMARGNVARNWDTPKDTTARKEGWEADEIRRGNEKPNWSLVTDTTGKKEGWNVDGAARGNEKQDWRWPQDTTTRKEGWSADGPGAQRNEKQDWRWPNDTAANEGATTSKPPQKGQWFGQQLNMAAEKMGIHPPEEKEQWQSYLVAAPERQQQHDARDKQGAAKPGTLEWWASESNRVGSTGEPPHKDDGQPRKQPRRDFDGRVEGLNWNEKQDWGWPRKEDGVNGDGGAGRGKYTEDWRWPSSSDATATDGGTGEGWGVAGSGAGWGANRGHSENDRGGWKRGSPSSRSPGRGSPGRRRGRGFRSPPG